MQVTAISPINPEIRPPFRWTYIVLPAAILLVSVVLAAVFYPRLPAEVAYHFNGDLPDRWLGRAAFLTWTLVPQTLLMLSALAFVGIVIMGARRWSVESPALKKLLP